MNGGKWQAGEGSANSTKLENITTGKIYPAVFFTLTHRPETCFMFSSFFFVAQITGTFTDEFTSETVDSVVSSGILHLWSGTNSSLFSVTSHSSSPSHFL